MIFSAPMMNAMYAKIKYTRPAKIIPPCTKGTFSGITVPSGRIIAVTAARKAKDEPRNTGTLNLVQQWNIKVPTPAENNASDGLRPVSKGTSTVAPNMAKRC